MAEVSVTNPPTPPAADPAQDRIYITDRRAADTPLPSAGQSTEETAPTAHTHQRPRRRSAAARHGRLLMYTLAAAAGIAAGVAAAYISPLSAESFSHSLVMSEEGGFPGMLLRRMMQCGAFLAAEYIVGYFAAGGLLVWLLPLIFSMGTGLSAAGAVMLGGELTAVVFSVISTAVLLFGADTSGEFSQLLLRLVSGKGGSIVTDGAAAYHYTMRFVLYAALLLLLAMTEAGIRAAA